jgi:hypothetical protein
MAVKFQGGKAVPVIAASKKMDAALLRDLESTLFKLRDTSNKLATLDIPSVDIGRWADRVRVVVAEVMKTDDAQRLRSAINGGSMSMSGISEFAERWSQTAQQKYQGTANAQEINKLWSDVRSLLRLVFVKQQRILIKD